MAPVSFHRLTFPKCWVAKLRGVPFLTLPHNNQTAAVAMCGQDYISTNLIPCTVSLVHSPGGGVPRDTIDKIESVFERAQLDFHKTFLLFVVEPRTVNKSNAWREWDLAVVSAAFLSETLMELEFELKPEAITSCMGRLKLHLTYFSPLLMDSIDKDHFDLTKCTWTSHELNCCVLQSFCFQLICYERAFFAKYDFHNVKWHITRMPLWSRCVSVRRDLFGKSNYGSGILACWCGVLAAWANFGAQVHCSYDFIHVVVAHVSLIEECVNLGTTWTNLSSSRCPVEWDGCFHISQGKFTSFHWVWCLRVGWPHDVVCRKSLPAQTVNTTDNSSD